LCKKGIVAVSSEHDVVIRGGLIVDGSGAEPFRGDIAIDNGRISTVGDVRGAGREEVDASRYIVTPGFIDPHTHYDGQVTWESSTRPSANHGVTTVVIGNCGVGFAPCRPEDRDSLVRLMEGVEDIPGVVMTEGLPWEWETFPEYLDFVDSRERDVDTVALFPHACLRVYVMGERGANREPATSADLEKMTELTREAMEAGAFGFGTSRTVFHKSSEGKAIFSKDAAEIELDAIAQGMRSAGKGVIQAVIDVNENAEFQEELRLLERVAEKSGRPATFTLLQLLSGPPVWRDALSIVEQANGAGVNMKAQVPPRAVGILMGFDLSTNPFSLHPTYRRLHHLPLEEKVAELRKPAIREQILAEAPVPDAADQPLLKFIDDFDHMYPLGDPPNYEPRPEATIAAKADKLGITPAELLYDTLLEEEGHAVIVLVFANYADSNLDEVHDMMAHEHSMIGLGDGGAHYGMICDAGYPTFLLAYWVRDRDGPRFPLATAIKFMTRDPAHFMGLQDRGLLSPGYKADLNIIDFENLHLHAPRAACDLPAGGRRLTQSASGYVGTMVGGVFTYRDGMATGALPGRLVRDAQLATA
jgi:N-acyl-D-amino-acid deacylase